MPFTTRGTGVRRTATIATGSEKVKLFVPLAGDEAQAKQILADLEEFLSEEYGAVLTSRRIFRLTYRHDGRECRAEVGQHHPVTGEMVDAIFHDESIGVYYLCTRKHGVVRGHPIMVDNANVESAEMFDD